MDLGGGTDDSAWAPPAASRPPALGLLAGYRDFQQLARGGDSIVYRAHQDALDRDVAIKVVQLDEPESVARFRRELAITVRLGRQHPNIMTVLDTGTTSDGQPCLVMDYFELGSLHDRLVERGPLALSEVVGAGSVIADALGFAHAQGVLHRDVKPQNILVLPTSWVLADFGLARAIDAGHSASLERFSYRHASPQILDGEAPTVADDVYSLGSTLFTLLDGRAPFASDDPDEDSALSYLRRARTEPPRELRRTDVPPALAAIVARCLARRREDRFPDAGALRGALDAVPTESRNWQPASGSDSAPARPVDSDVDDDSSGTSAESWAPKPPPTPPEPDALTSPLRAATADSPVETPEPPAAFAPPATASAVPAQASPPSAAPSAPEPPVPAPSVAATAPPIPSPAAPAAPPPPTIPPTAPPVPTQQFAEPPVDGPALSALAGLPASAPPSRDADVTGIRPAPPAPPVRVEADPPARRSWLVFVAIAVVALGAGIGIALWRGGGSSTPASSPSPSTSPTRAGTSSAGGVLPISSLPHPSPTATAAGRLIEAKNPRIVTYQRVRPINQTSSSTSSSVVLVWTDPSKGTRSFIVFDRDGGKRVGVTAPKAGTTTVTLPNVTRGRHCYSVGVVTPAGTTIDVTEGPVLCKTT